MWKNHQTIPTKVTEKGEKIYEILSASFEGVKRFFIVGYFIAANNANNEAVIKNNKNYFLPRREINSYNILIHGKKFYDQPINVLIKQYDEVRKVLIRKSDD